jgi:tetratricopeptide (TPR) repeat protein
MKRSSCEATVTFVIPCDDEDSADTANRNGKPAPTQPSGSAVRLGVMKMLGVLTAWSFVACSSAVRLPAKAVELNTAGAQALLRGDLSAAEACLSVALEYSARFVEAWVNLGYVELRRGNFEQAGRDFAKARDLNQDIPAPHHALGLLADKEGRGEEAEKSYRAAIRVDPGFAPARANLARRLFARGQYEDAREQFQRLERVAPDSVTGWTGEAEALLQLGRDADAEGVVARARERFGDAPELLLLVGRERLARGEWDDAEQALAPLVGDADRSRACAALAWIAVGRVGRGDGPGALAAARAALAIDPGNETARFALALAERAPAGHVLSEK